MRYHADFLVLMAVASGNFLKKIFEGGLPKFIFLHIITIWRV